MSEPVEKGESMMSKQVPLRGGLPGATTWQVPMRASALPAAWASEIQSSQRPGWAALRGAVCAQLAAGRYDSGWWQSVSSPAEDHRTSQHGLAPSLLNSSGLTGRMRGRAWIEVISGSRRFLIVNDSVNRDVPTALLIHEVGHSDTLRPLMEEDLKRLNVQSGVTVLQGPREPYREPQQGSWCAMHAVNALMGKAVATPEHFRAVRGTQTDSNQSPGFEIQEVKDVVAGLLAQLGDARGLHLSRLMPSGQEPVRQSGYVPDESFWRYEANAPMGAAVLLFDPIREHFLTFKQVETEGRSAWVRLDSTDSFGQAPPRQSIREYWLAQGNSNSPDGESQSLRSREFAVLWVAPHLSEEPAAPVGD